MEVADHVRQAPLVEGDEFRRVRLPLLVRAVEGIESVPDLVAHDVRAWRRARTPPDLPLAVGASAGVPGGPPRRQRLPAQPAHVVEVGDAARADVNRTEARRELLLDQLW